MGTRNKCGVNRQAVVIIHGMGEQRPMDTLRSFVNAIKKHLEDLDDSEKNTRLRSKADGVSEIYETRRLSLSASKKRPITDFYEFYWAHNMRNNSFQDILLWLLKLLFSRRKKIPKRLGLVWCTVWLLLLFSIITVVAVTQIVGVNKINSLLSAFVALPTLISIITLSIKSSFLNSIGDAGRYFTPSPNNIGERSRIRQQGITFLKKIHDTTSNEKYGRIIVVAHSLGSVIAYDLLRLLWTEYNESYGHVSVIDQSAISEIEIQCNKADGITNPVSFQHLQYKCWMQQKSVGNKWLISDFITIGSPLCNADYLLMNNVSFDELKNQREFPSCPPVLDDITKTIHYNSKPYNVEEKIRTVKILHHAALFAITRWTNIYFSSDFIGGPMQRLFGKGVKDESIVRKSLWFFPGGHTNYWDFDNKASLSKIVEALRLKTR
ncbi:MAG: hypothetical protein HUU01_00550 [Saprospiraceae bacterium]|nr:hypothetical protein [Saprospiraceae bacterium]